MRRRLFAALCIALAAAPVVGHAHLLHKQAATLRVKGDRGYLAVAIPAAAFEDVDDDSDGRLSPGEIARHREEISHQFTTRFHVSGPEEAAAFEFAWVNTPSDAPSADHQDTPASYVIILAGAQFTSPPSEVTIYTDLFGDAPEDQVIRVHARKGEWNETGILRKDAPTYVFFSDAPGDDAADAP